ncbi:MAG: hypothetical protein KAT09_03170, partial [Candidatus Aegiribacteria sp.]|nr:hypothetical protein [Candidatus Aegiribacteria sp.]
MKYFLFILIFAALAFSDNGYTGMNAGVNPHSSDSDDITLTLVNDWTLADIALGLDVFEGPSVFYVLAVDKDNDLIRAYDPTSGAPQGTMSLDVANNSCFGIAWNNDPNTDTYYTNDWDNSILFYTEDFGTTWTTVTN